VSAFSCPFCGPRPLEEFSFHKTLPNVPGGPFAEVYLRSDDPTDSHEHWQHRYGCRTWLYVRRNPSTGQIVDVRQLTGSAP
jgi:sarcosine oxidase subunit delta